MVSHPSVMFLHRRRGSILHCYGDASMFGKALHRHTSWPIHDHHHHRHLRCLCTTKGTIRAGSISRDELYDLLRRCTLGKDLALGRHVHCSMMTTTTTTMGGGLDSINVLGDHLIRMFSLCGGSPLEASLAFSKVLCPSVYTWNAILSAMAGAPETAFELYRKMHEDGVAPVKLTFLPLLRACAQQPMLSPGRLIHEQLVRNSYESNLFIGCALIDMYSKRGSFDDGCKVFGSVQPRRDAAVYAAMISSCIDHGRMAHASRLLGGMLEEGIRPSPSILAPVLKACESVHGVASLHTCMICEGVVDMELALGNGLIEMYASFGALDESRRVFSAMHARNSASWASLVAGYVQHGCRKEAADLLVAMMMRGEEPPSGGASLRCMLKACADVCDLRLGRWFHDRAVRSEVGDAGSSSSSSSSIVCSLIDMYARCGSLEEARRVFEVHWGGGGSDKASCGDCWSAMMNGYASSGDGGGAALELFEKLQGEGVEASRGVLLGVVRACCGSASSDAASIRTGIMWVHGRIVRAMLEAEMDMASALIGAYAKHGRIEEARRVFDAMPRHDAVSFGAMIGAYADCGLGLCGLALFRQMEAEEKIEADRLTYVSAVGACADCSCSSPRLVKHEGRWIHHSIVERGRDDESDAAMGSALVDMYGKCGSVEDAEAVFGRLRIRDAVAWGVLIGGYVGHGLADASLRRFVDMHRQQGGIVSPSQSTVSSLLRACEMLGSAGGGMLLHAQAVESGYGADGATASALIAFYCAVGSLDDAASVFGALPDRRDAVTWGAMIAGHVAWGNAVEAMALSEEMAKEGTEPDEVACILLLQACAEVGAAAHGRLLHGRMIVGGLEPGAECERALVAMYARCGRLEDARRVLARSPNPGVASWGALAAALAHLGDVASLPDLLRGMNRGGSTRPDDVIFLNALSACARSGALQEGKRYLESMIEARSMMPRPKHYNCLVDLLGRSGSLSDAHDLLRCVPGAPDVVVGWLALLSGCTVHCNTGLGMGCYDAVVSRAGRHDASGFALMSSLRSSVEPSPSSSLIASPSFC